MLDLYPLMHALVTADLAGWTRQDTGVGRDHWRHGQGLDLIVERHRHKGHPWEILVVFDSEMLTLSCQHFPHPSHELGSALGVLGRWIRTLDLEPRQAIAVKIGGWLAAQDLMDSATCSLHKNRGTELVVFTTGAYGLRRPLVVPPRIMSWVAPDLLQLWQRVETPSADDLIIRFPPDATSSKERRRVRIFLPSTRHARMDMIASIPEEIRGIPALTDVIHY